MRTRFWKAPSPALAISLIALFVALGGTTYAATSLPPNSVGTTQLVDGAVTAAKIKNGAVTAAKIATGLATARRAVAENPHTSTDPCLASTPQIGIFCGTLSAFWGGGSFAATHIKFWRDLVGVVHIGGEAHFSSTFSAGGSSLLFYLPPTLRPKELLAFPVATGYSAGANAAGSGVVLVYPANFPDAAARGAVALYSAGVTGNELFIGDVQFRTD